MKINILTLFPEMFSALNSSIIGRAAEKNLIEIKITDIRDFTLNKHKKCDDAPYGGGSGMIMSVQPIYDAMHNIDAGHKSHRIYMSPQGKRLNQKKVIELSALPEITILCGHYEGVDQRAIDLLIDEEISIGDYVLTGGELPAMVLADCICRYIPQVLHSENSVEVESFTDNLLEYPHYTRPEDFMGLKVPEVLLSGNHKNIEKWRQKMQIETTKKKRPDMLNR